MDDKIEDPDAPTKPVEDPTFWYERERDTFAKGGMLHQIILDDSYDLWALIQTRTAGVIAQHVQSGSRVLDAGCGYGALISCFEEVAQVRAGWHVSYVGVDIAPNLIDIAKRRYPARDFRVADLRALPFADKHFDWVLCRSVEGMIRKNIGPEAWEEMLRELKRVAKKIMLIGYMAKLDDELPLEIIQ